jgi:hypothetical protein
MVRLVDARVRVQPRVAHDPVDEVVAPTTTAMA